jgi:hypothetical protein
MARNKGTFNFAANFESLNKAPLDARQVVDFAADLLLLATWADNDGNTWLFNGLMVAVVNDTTNNNGIYYLKDASNYTQAGAWEKLSTSSGGTMTFIGSGLTQVNQSGSTIVIFTPPTSWSGLTGSPSDSTSLVALINQYVTGGTTYNLESPAAITLGGITAGDVLTGKTSNQILEELLVPTLYPTLSNPSNSFVSALASLYEIDASITFGTTAGFNRGSIAPAYGTSGYRSGLPNRYNYSGAQLPSTFASTALTDAQTVTAYAVLQGIQSWSSSVRYDAGEQPLNSKGGNFSSPLASGTTGSQSLSTEGVYPIFATTVTIGVFTKQALQSMINANNIVYAVVPETGGNKQSFELPQAWNFARPLIGIQTYNTVSNAWEYQGGTSVTSLTYWSITSVTETIQGNVINYVRFTYNGVDRSGVQIRLVF